MDSAFAAIRWAILERGSENVTWLLSDERLGDHCCRLLYEMKIAAAANLELAVRLLACAHLDAWLAGLCISEATLTARGSAPTQHAQTSATMVVARRCAARPPGHCRWCLPLPADKSRHRS